MNTQVPRAVATQLFVCTLFMLAPFSYATSVAFVRDGDRILIAVDSRELQATVERETKASDASCKVAILGGKYVFVGALAIAHEDNDLYPQWRSTSEARAAYQGGSHTLENTVERWANQMTVLITQMYMAHPQLVSNAAANTEGQVSQGFFFGEDESGNVSAYFVIVEVTDVRLGVPQVRAVRGVIRLPYSPTRITEELMEGTTERAKRVQADWLIEQKHIPEQDKKWRWLQYVVKRTGDFDDVRVGGSVEVIEVQKGHSPHWLAQQSCSR